MKKYGKKSVLFICNHNSARSQMAEGLLRELYGKFYKVFSAGLSSSDINPLTLEVMEEIGIDMSNHRSKSLEEFKGKEMDIVVTVCQGAQDSCPVFLEGKKYIHKGFKDPSNFRGSQNEKKIQFREIRDEIKEWIKKEFDPEN